MTKTTEVDYLTEDPVLNEQKYMCISFLKPSQIEEKYRPKDTTVCAVKIRGSYDTYDEAKARADFLQKCDSNHNIYIGEVGKWCPFEDDPEKAKNSEYMNKDLNNLMKSYSKQQNDAKEYHELRKQDMVKKALDEVDNKKKENSSVIDVEDDDDNTSMKKKEKKKSKANNLKDMKLELDKDNKELKEGRNEINDSIDKLRRLEDELSQKIKEMELDNAKKTVSESQ